MVALFKLEFVVLSIVGTETNAGAYRPGAQSKHAVTPTLFVYFPAAWQASQLEFPLTLL